MEEERKNASFLLVQNMQNEGTKDYEKISPYITMCAFIWVQSTNLYL